MNGLLLISSNKCPILIPFSSCAFASFHLPGDQRIFLLLLRAMQTWIRRGAATGLQCQGVGHTHGWPLQKWGECSSPCEKTLSCIYLAQISQMYHYNRIIRHSLYGRNPLTHLWCISCKKAIKRGSICSRLSPPPRFTSPPSPPRPRWPSSSQPWTPRDRPRRRWKSGWRRGRGRRDSWRKPAGVGWSFHTAVRAVFNVIFYSRLALLFCVVFHLFAVCTL